MRCYLCGAELFYKDGFTYYACDCMEQNTTEIVAIKNITITEDQFDEAWDRFVEKSYSKTTMGLGEDQKEILKKELGFK